MLVDEAVLTRPEQSYDVVVVGAGAAGLTLAQALGDARRRVLVIEAGATRESPRGRGDYRGTVEAGSSHPRPDLYRVRALGGTSRIWGGRCIPFDPIDFAARDWVPHSGWPLSFTEVSRYYPAALQAAEAGQEACDPAAVLPASQAELVPGLDGPEIRTTLERFSRPTNFWTRYGSVLRAAPSVHVLCGAAVTQIHLSPDGHEVASVEVVARSGKVYRVAAAAFVLAGGGLETTRLLLASNRIRPAGIGNGGDRLGRTYMSHLCTSAALVAFNPAAPVAHDYFRDPDGIYLRRRLWLTEAAQRRYRLLNTTFRTHLPDPGDARHGDAVLSAMFLAKSFVQREYAAKFSEGQVGAVGYARHLGNVLRQPVSLARFARMWMRERVRADRKLPSVVLPSAANSYVLEFHAEQAPDLDSRVTLAGERDRFGLPRLHIDWRVGEIDLASLERAHRVLDRQLVATGTGRLVTLGNDLGERVRRHGVVGGHHIGTTRMSDDERTGVVDRDCRVHGTANLYVASASVLPTSGQANPTLTVLALALRLADHLGAPHARAAPAIRTAPEHLLA